MTQSERVKAFKRDLANYRYKKSQIQEIKDKIEECYDRLGGVRGIDPSKEPMHTLPDKEMEYKLRDRISQLEAKLDNVCAQTEEIRQTLDKIEKPLRRAVCEVYMNGHTLRSEAQKMFISPSGLRKRINKAIEKALII